MNELIQIVAGAVGSLGFGILFNVRGKHLLAATLAGLCSWAIYLLLGYVLPDEAIRYFIVSMLVSLYCEVMARVLRTPTTTFLITSLIPLIPGGGLYYTMTNAFLGKYDGFMERGVTTLSLAVALALGVIVVTVVTETVSRIRKK